MCGIVGFFGRGGEATWRAALEEAVDAQRHRGPDDCGTHVVRIAEGTLGLGHRRLSIRDLSPAGRQPLLSEDRQVAAVCNGEIYNEQPLRAELEARGHVFRSHSDSELFVHGFEEFGPDFVRRLNGMFAFAVWDGRARKLWFGRDRVGIKPLLFARCDDGIVFGSEMTGLARWPGVSRRIDLRGLHQYLAFGYALTPTTLLQAVQKIRPGCVMSYDPQTDQLREHVYWSLAEAFLGRATVSQNGRGLSGDLWALLDDAVRARQVADVPLGSFLSGGVDSTAISALLGQAAPGSQTFCCDFAEATFSEAAEAERSAASLGLQHTSSAMHPPTAEEMAFLVRAADEPLGDSSFLPYYRLSKFARERVTVALSGDGADELLAGYVTYKADRIHHLIESLPGVMRRGLAGHIAPRIRPGHSKVGLAFRLRQFLAAADATPERAHTFWRCLWSPADMAGMLAPDVADELEHAGSDPFDDMAAYFDHVPGLPFLQRALYVDLSTWMLDDILVKVDRASMAHALEVRVPFLDHRFVEWCAGLPAEYKLRGNTGKWILRDAARQHVRGIRFQRRKQGFNAPVGHWLSGDLRPWAEGLLEERGGAADWLARGGAHQRYWNEHINAAADHGFKLWALLWLLEWCRRVGATL